MGERMIAQRMFDMVDDIVVDRRSQQQQQIVRYPSSHQRYELIDNNEKFELKVDVPGVEEENIDVKLEEGGRRLTVRGRREASSESSRFASEFSKTFSLDETVDAEKLTATVKNGVLTVSAPKDSNKLEENVRRIPVVAAAAAVDTADEKDENESADNSSNDDDSLEMDPEEKEKVEEETKEAAMDLDKE